MRAERFLLYEFGDEDFLVDFAADSRVTLPFVCVGVIGRGGGKRNCLHLAFERRQEFFERLLPFVLQMMCLVKTNNAYFTTLHLFYKVESGIVRPLLVVLCSLHCGVQSLVCYGSYRLYFVEIARNAFFCITVA